MDKPSVHKMEDEMQDRILELVLGDIYDMMYSGTRLLADKTGDDPNDIIGHINDAGRAMVDAVADTFGEHRIYDNQSEDKLFKCLLAGSLSISMAASCIEGIRTEMKELVDDDDE